NKEGRDFEEVIKDIASTVDGPVSAEVTSYDYQGMVEEARQLAAWADNVVVKIPMTEDGLKATHTLAQEGIKTNVTLIFSVSQGL
ncbi:transaldolase family protein, partial [Streptococcus pasteurianus]